MKALFFYRSAKIVAWVLAVGTLWLFLRTWLAPDACLDFGGGSFNYERWECTDEVSPYVYVPFHQLKSFWLFFAASCVACALQLWRPNAIQQAIPADRPKTGSG